MNPVPLNPASSYAVVLAFFKEIFRLAFDVMGIGWIGFMFILQQVSSLGGLLYVLTIEPMTTGVEINL